MKYENGMSDLMNKELNTHLVEVYFNATYPLLNTLGKLIVEVHHIGSTTFNTESKEVDILFVCKSSMDIFDYIEILTADGYLLETDKSPYFNNILIMTKASNDYMVNYIFISEKDIRIQEILDLSVVMKKSKVLQEELKMLRSELSVINPSEYVEKKYQFFNNVKDILLKGSML